MKVKIGDYELVLKCAVYYNDELVLDLRKASAPLVPITDRKWYEIMRKVLGVFVEFADLFSVIRCNGFRISGDEWYDEYMVDVQVFDSDSRQITIRGIDYEDWFGKKYICSMVTLFVIWFYKVDRTIWIYELKFVDGIEDRLEKLFMMMAMGV